MRMPLPILCVSTSLILTSLGCGEQRIGFQAEVPEIPPLPLGLDAELLKVPDDNSITPEKVALGWQLFYDPRLSVDKTPTLRNVVETAPYMHDGSMATLAEVLDYYDRGGETNTWLDEKMRPLDLTDQEKEDLLAFLESLTGDVPEWALRAPLLPPEESEG